MGNVSWKLSQSGRNWPQIFRWLTIRYQTAACFSNKRLLWIGHLATGGSLLLCVEVKSWLSSSWRQLLTAHSGKSSPKFLSSSDSRASSSLHAPYWCPAYKAISQKLDPKSVPMKDLNTPYSIRNLKQADSFSAPSCPVISAHHVTLLHIAQRFCSKQLSAQLFLHDAFNKQAFNVLNSL